MKRSCLTLGLKCKRGAIPNFAGLLAATRTHAISSGISARTRCTELPQHVQIRAPARGEHAFPHCLPPNLLSRPDRPARSAGR